MEGHLGCHRVAIRQAACNVIVDQWLLQAVVAHRVPGGVLAGLAGAQLPSRTPWRSSDCSSAGCWASSLLASDRAHHRLHQRGGAAVRDRRHPNRRAVRAGGQRLESGPARARCHAGRPLLCVHAALHLLLRHRVRLRHDGDDDLCPAAADSADQFGHPTSARGRGGGVEGLRRTRMAGVDRRAAAAGPPRNHDGSEPDAAVGDLHAGHRGDHGRWRLRSAAVHGYLKPRHRSCRLGRSGLLSGGRGTGQAEPARVERFGQLAQSHHSSLGQPAHTGEAAGASRPRPKAATQPESWRHNPKHPRNRSCPQVAPSVPLQS